MHRIIRRSWKESNPFQNYSQRVHFCMTKDSLKNFHINIFCLSAWKNQENDGKQEKELKSHLFQF